MNDYAEHMDTRYDCYDEIPYAGPGADFYCDYCEQTGHPFSACPARDDSFGDDI